MPEKGSTLSDAQHYWVEFVQLVVDAGYIRHYRDSLTKWVTWLAVLRAIATCSSIGGWLVAPEWHWIWTGILVAAQIADALKRVFPFYRRRNNLNRWARALGRLLVDTRLTWGDIDNGRYTNAQIRRLSHQMIKRRNRLDQQYAPQGLARRDEFLIKAEAEARKFFSSRYNVEESGDGHRR